MTSTQSRHNCARCQSTDNVVIFRKELLCKLCFRRFLGGKLRFHLDKFKVTYPKKNTQQQQQPKLQVEPPLIGIACSFGTVSLALLSLVNQLVADQKEVHNGRTGFRPVFIFVDESSLCKDPVSASSCIKDVLEKAQNQFPLVDVCLVEIDEFISLNLSRLIPIDSKSLEFCWETQASSKLSNVSQLLESLPSRTSKQDVLNMIRTMLLAHTASRLHCETLLFGICATKIAEIAITSTAKGRGYSLPFLLGHDQLSLDGSVHMLEKDTVLNFIYPLRDVLFEEAKLYITTENLDKLVLSSFDSIPGTARAMSIDELVAQYFRDIQTDFPSIVFTVGRTIAKLAPPLKSNSNHHHHLCDLCGYPCDYTNRLGQPSLPQDWLENITVREPAPGRLGKKIDDTATHNGNDLVHLCYACLVVLRGSKTPVSWIHRPKDEKQQILDTYLL